MDCTNCKDKVCIKSQDSCSKESFDKEKAINKYMAFSTSKIVKSAALLVDNGRAGTLSRIDEIIEFAKSMRYNSLGLAYCYGMEKFARAVQILFAEKGIQLSTVSCSIGGIKQSEINHSSCIHKVSCNPIGQALQLNAENVDFTLIMGICLGHDILLQQNLFMDFTTLIVKDRVFKNNPINIFYFINV